MKYWWFIFFFHPVLYSKVKDRAEGSLMMPYQIEKGQLEDKAGAQVPPDIKLVNQDNKNILLGNYFNSGVPIVLTLGYYGCPMLCTLVLNGLVKSLKQINYQAGKDYKLVSISIDHREKADLAKKKQHVYSKALGINTQDWSFHVTNKEEAQKIAKILGFNYYFDKKTDQFAHGAGFFVLTETGKLARTLFGISFAATDTKLAITEASQGKVGSFLDKVLLSCFHYNPDSHRYGVYIFGIMRLGGILTILILGAVLLMYFRFERRRGRGQANG